MKEWKVAVKQRWRRCGQFDAQIGLGHPFVGYLRKSDIVEDCIRSKDLNRLNTCPSFLLLLHLMLNLSCLTWQRSNARVDVVVVFPFHLLAPELSLSLSPHHLTQLGRLCSQGIEGISFAW